MWNVLDAVCSWIFLPVIDEWTDNNGQNINHIEKQVSWKTRREKQAQSELLNVNTFPPSPSLNFCSFETDNLIIF